MTATRRRVGDSLATAFADFPEMRLALVFGSVAAGRERPESDLDTAVGPNRRYAVMERLAGDPADTVAGKADRPDLFAT